MSSVKSDTTSETELRTLKLEYRKLYGTSAKGKKRNNVEYLKSRIQEKKDELVDTDVSDSEAESDDLLAIQPVSKKRKHVDVDVDVDLSKDKKKPKTRIVPDVNVDLPKDKKEPKTRILPDEIIDHINALYQYHADTMLDLVEQVVKNSHDVKRT